MRVMYPSHGPGANSIFLRVLLDKKYALPYRVVDALVFHFLRFAADPRSLPVLWHQAFLVFAQRSVLRAPPRSVSGECPDTNLCPTGPVISGFWPQNPKNPVRLVTISCPGRLTGGALRAAPFVRVKVPSQNHRYPVAKDSHIRRV